MKTGVYIQYLVLFSLLLLSCDDKIRWEKPTEYPTDTETSGMYILCEGLFNMNNSSLSYYSFKDTTMSNDFFEICNGKKLGDTANDMQRYGAKIWCAVNVSSQIEVLDVNTGKSLAQLPLFNESGAGREPRCFAFYKDKAYICNFDGTVARIDTTTLMVEAYEQVGRNPDGICVANGKIYVSNSGGLDSQNPDNTISIIDIESFKEIKKIEVRNNMGTILSDVYGNIYAVSREKYNYETNDYNCRLHRIDSQTDKVITTYDLEILSFTISGHTAYMYSYNSEGENIIVMDTRTGQIIDYNFIKTPVDITRVYNISVNPVNGDVYICDPRNYVINGSVHCFTKDGIHKFTLDAQGINPNSIVFTAAYIEEEEEEPGTNVPFKSIIAEVFEYVPAPGQFINRLPLYEEGDDEITMRAKCLESFNKKAMICLGGFGGYITVGLAHPVVNKKGEYDFRVLGNGFDGSAEPGIVLVSKDTNGDGIPNDEWYELKGSEYDNPQTIHNYKITYYKPNNEADRVLWTDNQGESGYIERTVHKQSYYPKWIDSETITFEASRLPDNGIYDNSLGKWVFKAYEYGYADNHSNASDGSKFKIDWAIDKDGNSIELGQIDFIRIYTAVNQTNAGIVGEVSTEIIGIEELNEE